MRLGRVPRRDQAERPSRDAAEADGVEVHGGCSHVSAAAEPAFTEVYADVISQHENVAEEVARGTAVNPGFNFAAAAFRSQAKCCR